MLLSKILPHLLYDFQNEKDLVDAIEELSLKFTQKREFISDYLCDKRLASAYTAFYLTTNAPKFESVLKWMPKSFVDHLKSSTFIDLGSGPGTFSLAYREFAGESKKILQIESSATMREQARKIWDGFYAGETILQAENAKIIPEGEKFLLFGHSANEMGPAQALRYINEIRPDHILFIEPGTKDFFPQMLKIRDELIADGFQILFPCPHSSSCPLASSDNDWCHQFIHIRQNSEIERISQLVKKDRRHLPLTVHAYSRHDLKNESSVRVIRVFPETKFSFEWEVCELNVVKRYQIMKRGLSRSALKQLEGVLSGASLVVDVEKELENALRVKVKTLNNVPLLA